MEICDILAIKLVELRMDEMRFMAIYYVTRPRTVYGNINIKNIETHVVPFAIYIYSYEQYLYIYIVMESHPRQSGDRRSSVQQTDNPKSWGVGPIRATPFSS